MSSVEVIQQVVCDIRLYVLRRRFRGFRHPKQSQTKTPHDDLFVTFFAWLRLRILLVCKVVAFSEDGEISLVFCHPLRRLYPFSVVYFLTNQEWE